MLCLALAALVGCRAAQQVHDCEFAELPMVDETMVDSSDPDVVEAALLPQQPELAGPHSVAQYIVAALNQNPQIQASRKRVEAAAERVPQAASLKDPNIAAMGYPFYPNVQQTAAGRTTANVTVSQQVPWLGKLRSQADAAEAEVDMARAELAAAELEVVEQVKRAYFELYYVQRALAITQESRALAVDFSKVADARFRAAQVSQQDLLRADLEVSYVDTELVRLNQELQSAQARLARLLHVSPDTPVRALEALPYEELPGDLDQLYKQAIAARPELHAQLAAVRRDRLATDLARLQYFPDLTFSVGWGEMTTNRALSAAADGTDNVNVGLMANIPIYRKRLQAGVREAEAQTVAAARQYDDLRDRTQQEVKDLFAQATSQQELLRLFRTEIVPKADHTLKVSITAYESGEIDFLQLTDNWRQLLRYQLMQQRLESQLRQTLATLERVVGGMLPSGQAPQPQGEPVEPPDPLLPEPREP